MTDETEFLTSAPGALLLSFALMMICVPLRATPRVPNWSIPYICLIFGSIGYCLLEGWSFRNHLLGLIVGGCAVGLHQSVKQGKIGWREFFAQGADGEKVQAEKDKP